ncbi:hypothetical protein GCM10007972_03440 [Iodidimonas muriae]|uniref:Uncharacterized protein n=1 Tax=Iodidimonas muriae TaxID=261467 RepID=A0ABQ2L796_9PROT|nr:hypothetical protein JCM17843_26700 [Kordiimonadales bacterium JCM 17843]GGO05743.1 hypothetical protein GCM10007972_03440 [Iodidimonas muriae]
MLVGLKRSAKKAAVPAVTGLKGKMVKRFVAKAAKMGGGKMAGMIRRIHQ